MKGKNYFNWFKSEHKIKWLDNFNTQKINDFETYMEREFPNYYTFLFLSFDTEKSTEGKDYWGDVFYEYKKYDNINVKPGFGIFRGFKQPKTFKK